MDLQEQLASSIAIDEAVYSYFTSTPIGLYSELPYVAHSEDHPFHAQLKQQLQSIDRSHVEMAMTHPKFSFFHGNKKGEMREYEGRIWAIMLAMFQIIPAARLAALCPKEPGTLPAPLDHVALNGVDVSSDYLVPLSAFNVGAGRLTRSGYAFTALAPVESINSQYWFLNALACIQPRHKVHVRLDPLLVRPVTEYPQIGYRMQWYGRPLDWSRLQRLHTEEHGRWSSDNYIHGDTFTDYVWAPRDGMIHFRCEELPSINRVATRGSRYFHAIYDPSSQHFIHLDAAVRVYDGKALRERAEQHVRNSGKVGQRHKVFLVDGDISVDQFCSLCAQFYVWNDDVQRYFGATIPGD